MDHHEEFTAVATNRNSLTEQRDGNLCKVYAEKILSIAVG